MIQANTQVRIGGQAIAGLTLDDVATVVVDLGACVGSALGPHVLRRLNDGFRQRADRLDVSTDGKYAREIGETLGLIVRELLAYAEEHP